MNSSFEIEDLEFSDFLKRLRPNDKIEIYTDGSCIGNPGPGGWAGVFIHRDKRANISGFEKSTTNNRMELMAAIESVNHVPETISATIYTDSTYVKNGITSWIKSWQSNNWKSASGKPVKNQDGFGSKDMQIALTTIMQILWRVVLLCPHVWRIPRCS